MLRRLRMRFPGYFRNWRLRFALHVTVSHQQHWRAIRLRMLCRHVLMGLCCQVLKRLCCHVLIGLCDRNGAVPRARIVLHIWIRKRLFLCHGWWGVFILVWIVRCLRVFL